MAKITTIIDIGSNSMRMVVFKKTSRFGFHLINESKSKVKISEGCYKNNGNLQALPMQRAFGALESFLQIANNLKSRKILCVATSALRDAPNKKEFISKVSKELNINIKIIAGEKEAYYGGVAARNLIDCNDFTTVDIGGGSTEFAFINNGDIIDTISLNIGTVRIKELYFDKQNLDGAKNYIESQLKTINKKLPTIVGLGGTARAISKIILQKDNYPLDILHGFTYDVDSNSQLMEGIIVAKDENRLKELGVRKDRYDTISVGTFIFKTILDYFEVNKVITSGVGVREGVYLTDILRNSNDKFPSNFNVSIRSLIDRFVDDEQQSAYLGNNAKKIFDTLQPLHNLDLKYRSALVIASKLQLIGFSLNFYKNEDHTFNYILNGLNYGFTHEDKTLIAIVAKYSKKSLPKTEDIEQYKQLLPSLEIVQWLNFMMTLNISLNSEYSKLPYNYSLESNKLTISSDQNCYIVNRALQKIKSPINIDIELNKI
ncbi:MAG: Ppx/GppA phosphatase family protein [Campylobacterota bacterium]|nr:Ppx/GppA phosphatase family protein [Campylobacterota bacterium]